MKYWHAVTLDNIGQITESLPLFKDVFSKNKNWVILTSRLKKSNLLNVDEELLKKILSLVQ